MILKKKLLLINYLYFSLTIVQSQTINGYFPLSVDNKWYFYLPGNGDSIRTILNVSKDTIMSDGNSYANIDRYEKTDTFWAVTEGSLYLRQVGNVVYEYPDSVFFDFDWTDSTSMEELPVPFSSVKVDTSLVFNKSRKTYYIYIMDPYEYVSFSDSIGFNALYALAWRDWTGSSRYLKGCIINGTIYGDIIIQLEFTKENIPQAYELPQNYPNPFNPTTTIKFQIPNSNFTTLRVYNILGEKVATLVSTKLHQGNYTYQFDGKNLASGVYFYCLQAGNFVQTKKMLMIK